MELEKAYDHTKVEAKIYQQWLDSGFFNPDNLKGEPYTIIMPPPNVTGALHMGHMFEYSEIDITMRWRRMCGYTTLWLPGFDHAGIAVEYASPLGGTPPEDGYDESDPAQLAFRNSSAIRRMARSRKLSEVDVLDYDAIFFPG